MISPCFARIVMKTIFLTILSQDNETDTHEGTELMTSRKLINGRYIDEGPETMSRVPYPYNCRVIDTKNFVYDR
jgi:hypothetical protein